MTYEYKLVNVGVLSLYDIALRDSVLQEHGTTIPCKNVDGETVVGSSPGAVTALARKPDNGLPPAGLLVCTGTDVVTQEEV